MGGFKSRSISAVNSRLGDGVWKVEPMTRKSLLGLWCVVLLAFLTSVALTSYAATTPKLQNNNGAEPTARITQPIDPNAYVILRGNTRPEARVAGYFQGPANAAMPIEHMLLFLQRSPEQEQALDQYIDSLNDRKSPNFHKWLTAEQLGSQYGVADEDIQKLSNWLEAQGFVINRVYPNKLVLDISGTAGALAQGFHVQIGQLNVDGKTHFANLNDPQIPAALAPVIKGFASLNDFRPHAMHKVAPQYTFAGCASSSSLPTEPGTCYAVTPQDDQTIYGLTPLYNAGYSGQGQTIYLVEDTDTYGGSNHLGDWTSYVTTFGLTAQYPQGNYALLHPGGCTDPGTNADDSEADLDVEVASAIAPSANIRLISCPSGSFTFGGQIATQNLINESSPTLGVISVSYGLCETVTGNGGNAAFAATYQQAAAMGFSVFVAAGDEGPSSCSPDFTNGTEYDSASLGVTGWGSSQYNVSVGGTDFEDTYNGKTGQNGGQGNSAYWSANNTQYYGSALSYIPEIPWNDSCAMSLISFVDTGSFIPYGASPATCNNATFDTSTTYLSTGAGSGGASNCATGSGGANTRSYLISEPQCQGWPKPSYQSGTTLAGGVAVYGSTNDGVRDIPDVSMFAANGIWGHFQTVCWSDPSYTSEGAASCSGAPSTWSGFGGTSVATPVMAAVQALINQQTGENWGNPNPVYYQIAQNEYGTAGGTFQGTACNSSTGSGIGCAFNDITQGDIDLACEDNGTVEEAHCYKPTGTHGVDSTDVITTATVITGGTGYTSAPTCAIAGPTNANPYLSPTNTTLYAGGTQATCTATVNSASPTAVWTAVIESASAAGFSLELTSPTGAVLCGPYTLTGSSTSTIASAFNTWIAGNCSTYVSATVSSHTVTITSKTAGYAGDFIVGFGPNGYYEGEEEVLLTQTTIGQGPNYVSGITITNGGVGYQPETPVTLAGGGGSGAIAVANTSPGTASSSYQPSYGAAPGYDLATGLGTVNGVYLANNCQWHGGTSAIYSPVPSSTLTGSTATFQWCVYPGATNYWVDIGSSAEGNNYLQTGSLPPTTFAVTANNLPTDGSTIYVTWWYYINGSWSYTEYQYTAFGGGSQIGVITSPTPGSTLSGSSQLFSWTAGSEATAYWIDAGSTSGGNQYFQSGNIGNVTSYNVNNLPTNGSTVYITLYSLVNGNWLYNEYQYTAYNLSSSQGVLTTPTPGSQFAGTTVTFDWTPGAGASNYWMDIGNTSGGNQYYQSGPLGNVNTVTVNGLPMDGSTVYVTLYSLVGGQWLGTTYTYTAFNPSNGLAVMTSPSNNGATINSTQYTFMWSAGTNASGYWLDIGSSMGGNDIYQSGQLNSNQLSTTVSTLPDNGTEIYATLYTLISGQWYYNQYMYCSGVCIGSPINGARTGPTGPNAGVKK